MTPLRIAFMGTPDFAVPALYALYDSKNEVVCAYTQPPRPKGRGQHVQKSPVHQAAEKKNIPVYHPETLKTPEEQAKFAALNIDMAVVAAYGLILPKPVLTGPKHGCINIHASLLPRWRGASPIQRAILAGDQETGITLMQMDEGLDTGAIIIQRTVQIGPRMTAALLHDELAVCGASMIAQALGRLTQEGHLESTPQDNTKSTYAKLLKKEDGRVFWTQTASEIDRQVRALNPWPGVWCRHNDQTLKILETFPEDQKSDQPTGMVIDRNGLVACGGGTTLRVLRIQPAGARAMTFADAVNGGYIQAGDVLA